MACPGCNLWYCWPVLGRYQTDAVLIAVGMTVIVVLGLTLFAWQTKVREPLHIAHAYTHALTHAHTYTCSPTLGLTPADRLHDDEWSHLRAWHVTWPSARRARRIKFSRKTRASSAMHIGDRKLLSGTVCAALKDTIRLRPLLCDLLLVLQLVCAFVHVCACERFQPPSPLCGSPIIALRQCNGSCSSPGASLELHACLSSYHAT